MLKENIEKIKKQRYNKEYYYRNRERLIKEKKEYYAKPEPIEIDKFEYVCKKCHKEIPRRREVKC